MIDKPIHRNTRQRAVVLEELRKVTSHPTAAELYEMVRKRLLKISLGTVYRNLEILTRAGQIQKLTLGPGEARFDGDPAPHYHVRCVHCRRTDDLYGIPTDLVDKDLTEVDGYRILGHRLEFVGVCPHCRSSRDAENTPTPNQHGDQTQTK